MDLRKIYGDILRANGFAVRHAADGVDALRSVENMPPDVIVLDIMLPTLDGYSVRAEIAADAHTRDIPVVVVSGADVDPDRLKTAYILRKPVEPAALLAMVRGCLANAIQGRYSPGPLDWRPKGAKD
jgi:DNA-binding response OmpR family regulator